MVNSFLLQVFLSQPVGISILQDFKEAFYRCKILVNSKDLPKHATDIYNILVQYLCSDFINYAIGMCSTGYWYVLRCVYTRAISLQILSLATI